MTHSLRTFSSIQDSFRIILHELRTVKSFLFSVIEIDNRLFYTWDNVNKASISIEIEEARIESQKQTSILYHLINKNKPYTIKKLPEIIERLQHAIIQIQDIKEENEVKDDTDRRIFLMCRRLRVMQAKLVYTRNELERLQETSKQMEMITRKRKRQDNEY